VSELKIVSREYELLDGSKQILVERVGNGSIIKRFDKTPLPAKETDIVCPHFLELKWATGCPYNCSWCYLKGTLRFSPRRARPDVKDFNKVAEHVRTFLQEVEWCEELLNSGEIADSLMWEKTEAPFSKSIVPLFSAQRRHRVLLVSKSNNIHHLLANEYQDCAVTSFSFNADVVAQRFERGAPTVGQRIEAARKLSQAGYEVRIRIDPMIPVPRWERHYQELIDQMFSAFTPARVTLGSLRGLQSTINGASDRSWVKYLSDRSNWGRRIDRNIRFWMYQKVIEYLKQRYEYTEVGLCKETLEIWHRLGMDYRKIKCNCIT
jgi:spore photoproduct lyase